VQHPLRKRILVRFRIGISICIQTNLPPPPATPELRTVFSCLRPFPQGEKIFCKMDRINALPHSNHRGKCYLDAEESLHFFSTDGLKRIILREGRGIL